MTKKPFSRLPKSNIPTNYSLKLQPDLEKFTFSGENIITLEVKQETSTIVLNSAEIEIKHVKYSGEGQGFAETEVKTEYSIEDETVTFCFPAPLKVGRGTLTILYSGILNDRMKGFYRSKYFSPDGEARYAAATQFEATEARKAFPCWDEPAVKATFDITMVVPNQLVALSNMPEKQVMPLDTDSSYKVVSFQRTPVMSTYLVAFIVGEYDYVEGTDEDGVLIRIYTPVGKKEQGLYALEVTKKTLPFYKEYFNMPYNLPKIDLIGLADFSGGAMENWGLLTYRESALMIDPVKSSSAARQRVALIVGHELAHQWFGNLVTPEWWTNLWLKEGFATWIEYLCVDFCFPEYDIWTQFASYDFTKALELDSYRNSHPIEVPVGHPCEIDEIFDDISYSKGASIIRMLHSWIGNKSFQAGMYQYLERHKYGNTTTEDLWQALGAASGQPVPKVMDTWTKQMGFPILQVSETVEGSTHQITVQQDKFCADGSTGDSSSMWLVPITICTEKCPDQVVFKDVLHSKEAHYVIKDPGAWVKVNVGAVGFYRTCYSSSMLEALLPAIRDQTLSPRDRLALQNDLFALARAGQLATVEALKVAGSYSGETNYTVWADLNSNLMALGQVLQYSNLYDAFQSFLIRLFEPVSKSLGWQPKENESSLDNMLRGLVMARLGKAGHEETIAQVQQLFKAYCAKSSNLQADLRGAVYAVTARNGNMADYEKMMQLYDEADMQEERVQIMRCLGFSQDSEWIKKALQFAISDKVRSQDSVTVITSCTGSKTGQELAWKFVQDNWDQLHDRYRGGFLFSRLVKCTTDGFASEAKAQEVAKFFESHPAPAAKNVIQRSLENIRLNERQLRNNLQALRQYLAAS